MRDGKQPRRSQHSGGKTQQAKQASKAHHRAGHHQRHHREQIDDAGQPRPSLAFSTVDLCGQVPPCRHGQRHGQGRRVEGAPKRLHQRHAARVAGQGAPPSVQAQRPTFRRAHAHRTDADQHKRQHREGRCAGADGPAKPRFAPEARVQARPDGFAGRGVQSEGMTPLHGVDDAHRDQKHRRLSHGGTEDQPAEVNTVTRDARTAALLSKEDFERQGVWGQPAHKGEGREGEGEGQPSRSHEARSEELRPPGLDSTGKGLALRKETQLFEVPWVGPREAWLHHANRQGEVEPHHRHQQHDRAGARFRPYRHGAQPLTTITQEVHQREKSNRGHDGRAHEGQRDEGTKAPPPRVGCCGERKGDRYAEHDGPHRGQGRQGGRGPQRLLPRWGQVEGGRDR